MASPNLTDLIGIYRSFRSKDDIAASQLQGDLSKSGIEVEKDYLELFLQLLFPKTSGAYISSKVFWEKLTDLGRSTNDENTNAAKLIARLARVYYYHSGDKEFEKKISDWYKTVGGRPSAYKYPSIVKNSKTYSLANSVREMLPADFAEQPNSAELLMVLVDTPGVDLKLRDTDKVEVFANYIPAVSMASAVPFVDVKFIDKRFGSNKALNTMSQLRFLLGSGRQEASSPEEAAKLKGEGATSATSLLYDANKYQLSRTNQQVQNANPAASPNKDVQQTMVGMEMFTMPQTLVNMDYNQELNPRYNPVINPTVPFGTISSVGISVTSAMGLMSYKTAKLTLKIFDRSRLVEIADFLNPKLYSSATVLLTFGWRAPLQISASGQSNDIAQNEYFNFINNNMLKSETYGIRNSSISIDNSGITTVDLDLYVKGVAELRDVTPNGASISFDKKQNEIQGQLDEIKKLAQDLKLTSLAQGAKEIRGSVVIAAALGGRFPELNGQDLVKELQTIKRTLSGGSTSQLGTQITEFLKRLDNVYAKKTTTTGVSPKVQLEQQAQLEKAAKAIIQERLTPLAKQKVDLFAHVQGLDKQVAAKNEPESSSDDEIVREPNHPLTNLRKIINNEAFIAQYNQASKYGQFGDVTFGKVFFTYFASAFGGLSADGEPINDEYQVFFYNLNRNAGKMANLNIAEFPMDMTRLEDAYARRVVEQKGENMTLVNFLEIVRSSQFDDIRHPAFGFSNLYVRKNGDLVLRDKFNDKEEELDSQLTRRIAQANQETTGEPFTQPTIDFYVETGFESATSASSYDLLLSFEKAAASRSRGGTKGGKRIVRIHIYDKAATPHTLAEDIFKSNEQGGYIRAANPYRKQGSVINQNRNLTPEQAELPANTIRAAAGQDPATARLTVAKANEISAQNGDPTRFEYVSFKDANGNPRFDLVKREISRFVPTLIIGAQGSLITNVSYSSNQDDLLSTIMMQRNKDSAKDPAQPNGAGLGDLPLRVIPGQLTLTMLGCPVLEYMQQFFVDLGTGTTIDNLYNITGLTHTIAPGKFTSELKLSLYDAYGKYEGADSIKNYAKGLLEDIKKTATGQKKGGKKPVQISGKNRKGDLNTKPTDDPIYRGT